MDKRISHIISGGQVLPLRRSSLFISNQLISVKYGKCSKISNTLKLLTPKIIAENNFQNILKNRTLTFF